MRLKLHIFPGKFPPGTIFQRNKQGARQLSSLSLDENLTSITDLISKQHWSKLKTHLQKTDANTLLQQLVDSGADPELTLRYCNWSRNEFKLPQSLELTFRILHSLALAKKYPKIRSFLHDFVRNEDEDYSVSAIFNAISSCGDSFCVNSIIADMLILAYVSHLKTLRGLEAFKRAGYCGFKLSVTSCNPLLSGLVKKVKIAAIEFVYGEMIRRKIELNVISFNIVINGLCKAGKLDKAGDVIEDMKTWGDSPDVVTYNTLIDGYCKMGRVAKMHKADAILKEMVATGIQPNRFTFNILIGGFCKDGNVSAAVKVFEEMKRQGLTPAVVTYNTLINGFFRDGTVDEAIALRDEMISSAVEPDIATHNALINGFCKNKMLNEAIKLLNDMPKQGLDPNVLTYTTLIDAYCNDGKTEDAFALCNSMVHGGVSPDISTYNC